MNIIVKRVDPKMENLRYLNGPWQNDACIGYTILAMHRTKIDLNTIQKVTEEMKWCFDDTTVEEAAKFFRKWRNQK